MKLHLILRIVTVVLLAGTAPAFSAKAKSHSPCTYDFLRLCAGWPVSPELYAICRLEHDGEFSEACVTAGSKSPEEAAWMRSADNTDAHSPVLIVPAGARETRFRRSGLSDRAYFRFTVAYPAEDLVKRIIPKWEKDGWYQNPKADATWRIVVSSDGHTAGRVRTIQVANAKSQMAYLHLAYLKKFDWVVSPTQASTLDLGTELRVLELVTPVRRYWDGKLPVFFGREIQIDEK